MSEPTPEKLSILIRNELSEIEAVHRIISAFVDRHQLPRQLGFDVNLALDEILTNIISYGYEDGTSHQIGIRVGIRGELSGEELTLAVEDDAHPFNPLDVPAPDLNASIEDRSVGGLGVFLVRKLMDHLEYHRQDGKNLLVMRKKIVRP